MSMKIYKVKEPHTQNDLVMNNLMAFYEDKTRLHQMMNIINGESNISLRIVDWFVTNYAKQYYTIYNLPIMRGGINTITRFKVYHEYKLELKSYSKRRFDPFCRWERTTIPYDDTNCMETTIGQLNFFKWAIENQIIDYISKNYNEIEKDMNDRNSISKKKEFTIINDNGKTRKKREELSISACKCIKKETVKIIVKFD